MPTSNQKHVYKIAIFLYFEPFWSHLTSKSANRSLKISLKNFSKVSKNAELYEDFKTGEKFQIILPIKKLSTKIRKFVVFLFFLLMIIQFLCGLYNFVDVNILFNFFTRFKIRIQILITFLIFFKTKYFRLSIF